MYAKSLLLSAVAVSTASAAALAEQLVRCAAPPPTAEQLQMASAMASAGFNSSARAGDIAVDVYFHVVAVSESEEDGNISDSALDQQFAVMNDNYAPYGISFNLKGTDRTVNSQWSNDGAELEMKKALRKGGYSTLNVYFQKSLSGALGYCYFPDNVAPESDDFYFDGCTILYTTVPGGPEENFNEGKTVTHEVGHWFGLFHTFQGGCDGDGDSVADTPAQASPTSGCPEGRDSCPAPGLDPIHNYMDYSYDPCYNQFTAGQKMFTYFDQFRQGK